MRQTDSTHDERIARVDERSKQLSKQINGVKVEMKNYTQNVSGNAGQLNAGQEGGTATNKD